MLRAIEVVYHDAIRQNTRLQISNQDIDEALLQLLQRQPAAKSEGKELLFWLVFLNEYRIIESCSYLYNICHFSAMLIYSVNIQKSIFLRFTTYLCHEKCHH